LIDLVLRTLRLSEGTGNADRPSFRSPPLATRGYQPLPTRRHYKIREGAHPRAVVIRTIRNVERGHGLGIIERHKDYVGDLYDLKRRGHDRHA
jgi:hypothetical protein